MNLEIASVERLVSCHLDLAKFVGDVLAFFVLIALCRPYLNLAGSPYEVEIKHHPTVVTFRLELVHTGLNDVKPSRCIHQLHKS
jgi:hypothetical protein